MRQRTLHLDLSTFLSKITDRPDSVKVTNIFSSRHYNFLKVLATAAVIKSLKNLTPILMGEVSEAPPTIGRRNDEGLWPI